MAGITGYNLRGITMVGLLVAAALWSNLAAAQDAAGIFKTKCAACHGEDGSGNTVVGKKLGVHDFHAPDVQKMTDTELASIVSQGKNKMPLYEGKLKPEEIKRLVIYIRELAKKQ